MKIYRPRKREYLINHYTKELYQLYPTVDKDTIYNLTEHAVDTGVRDTAIISAWIECEEGI